MAFDQIGPFAAPAAPAPAAMRHKALLAYLKGKLGD